MPSYTITYEYADRVSEVSRLPVGERSKHSCAHTTIEARTLHEASSSILADLPDVRIVSITEMITVPRPDRDELLSRLEQAAVDSDALDDSDAAASIEQISAAALSSEDAIQVVVDALSQNVSGLGFAIIGVDGPEPIVEIEVFDPSTGIGHSKYIALSSLLDDAAPNLGKKLLTTAQNMLETLDDLA